MKPSINCLRCRQCQLEPDTDFNSNTPMIFCARSNQRQAAVISFDCHKATTYYKYVNGVYAGGDLTRNSSDVEKKFIEQRAALPASVLAKSVKRSKQATQNLRSRLVGAQGYTKQMRDHVARIATTTRKRGGKNPCFNAAQHDYIMTCYNGGKWPFRTYHLQHGREAYEKLKQEITDGVAARGCSWRWESIVKHVQYTSPHYQRVQAKKREAKRQKKLDTAAA